MCPKVQWLVWYFMDTFYNIDIAATETFKMISQDMISFRKLSKTLTKIVTVSIILQPSEIKQLSKNKENLVF